MKKIVISALALIGLSSFQIANAADLEKSTGGPNKPFSTDQLDYLNKEFNKHVSSYTFYGLTQAQMNFADSQRNKPFDFAGQHLRLGVKTDGKLVNGQVELEFVDTENPVIRQAQVNFNIFRTFLDNVYSVTSLSLGGVRIGGALSTAPDSANVPSQFSRQDGAYLEQSFEARSSFNLTLGLGLFNALFGNTPDIHRYMGWGENTGYLTKNSRWGFDSKSPNTNPAFVGSLNSTLNLSEVDFLIASLYAGVQKNAAVAYDTQGNAYQTRDVSHIEGSLVYNNTDFFGTKGIISANGMSVWYEREAYAKGVATTPNSTYANTLSMTDAANADLMNSKSSGVASLLGVGFAGDTSPYLTKIFRKNDRFTYAFAYTNVINDVDYLDSDAATSSTTNYYAYPTFKKYKVYQISTSLGYGIRNFETAINFEYSNSDSEIFTGTGNDKVFNEYKAYITAAYVF
jgi:hypothetical protein